MARASPFNPDTLVTDHAAREQDASTFSEGALLQIGPGRVQRQESTAFPAQEAREAQEYHSIIDVVL